ncbi:hypothetical protein B0J11DRAFT_541141 [Dendryphion nanum]|uniref:Uncharacterized protein n=1 Tax=Dendryphion nanum TaxID=256645 RepID=A0A9P9D8P8_9PLEO|nr:hypothetical protein B0J11DRAFT_541141 [Dendryphion nanum]
MPRRLPWLKGNSIKTQSQSSSKPPKKVKSSLDEDEGNFFDGTILASPRKGTTAVDLFDQSDDDDLLELPPATTYQKGKYTTNGGASREQSSSPPPRTEQPPPTIDYMRKAVSQYDLRDDEWRMVEDELLSTAQSFTRHILLEDYEKFKEIIKTKKPVARPVVPNAKPSDQGRVNAKAERQSKAQKKTLKEIFSATGKKDLEDFIGQVEPSRLSMGSGSVSSLSGLSKQRRQENTSDSEDLDTPRPSLRQYHAPSSASLNPFAKPRLPTKDKPKQPVPPKSSSQRSESKPTTATARSIRRASFIDSFNEDFPTLSPPQGQPNQPSFIRSSSPSKSSQPSGMRLSAKMSHPVNMFADLDIPQRNPMVKEHANKLAKRKARPEKEKEQEKKKAVKLEDIPTFMF